MSRGMESICNLPKGTVQISIDIDGRVLACPDIAGAAFDSQMIQRPTPPVTPTDNDCVSVPLLALAWGRSGDKGDKANVGIIARRPEYLPYLFNALTPKRVAQRFAHFLPRGASDRSAEYVERYLMPGTHAINFLLHQVLGGGGMASLRNDPQGKGYAQILLDVSIPISRQLAADLGYA